MQQSLSNSVAGDDRIVPEVSGRFHCPRCPVELSRVEFVKHLWLEHRLVLDGQSVREPWRLIEDWVEEYFQNSDPKLLIRCRVFAQRLDPDQGLLRVQRVFLAHRIDDEAGRHALFAEAGRRRVSLCPRCFAFVNAPEETPAPALSVIDGDLAKNGYQVKIEGTGLFSRLVLETPDKLIYRGTEPGQRLTFAGAVFFFAGPFVLAAFLLAFFYPLRESSPLGPVTFLLLGGMGAYVFSHWKWQRRVAKLDGAIDYAWTLMIPRMEASAFSPEDFAFVAALALTSIGHGQPISRAAILARVVNDTEKAVTAGTVPVTHLAALWRLVMEDKARMGDDPVQLAVDQAGRSLEGELPLSFAEKLLAHPENLLKGLSCQTRLRILLCDRAFEAGFEVRDLTKLANAAPFLAQALRVSDTNGLAGLRLLWSLRPRRPWDDLGPADTAFELAARAREDNLLLEKYPDLLLAAGDGRELYLCSRGLVFRGEVFTQFPRSIEVKRKWIFGGFELIVGDRRFQCVQDPGPIVQQMERWFRYYFGDWVHQVKDVFNWRSPGLPPNFRLEKTYACPGCRRELCPRTGHLAILREEIDHPRF